PLVEGPGDVYICGECIELCQQIIEQEKRRRTCSQGGRPPIPTREEVWARLDYYFPGQRSAEEPLASAAVHHYDRRRSGTAPLEASAILLAGPSRGSKVIMARALAHILGLPFAHGAPDGWPQRAADGFKLEPLLFGLLQAGDYDVKAAEEGLVYVDGIERRDVQQALLTALTGGSMLPAPGLRLETGGILFLCGGPFPGLEDALAARGRHPEQPLTNEDLLALGMLPELVRRLQAVVPVSPLDEEALARLLGCVNMEKLTAAMPPPGVRPG
ncbi:MAG TPA: ClpX C4-type zinc finger protein, partial [Gemmataceae bacterium]|nr:ClpX C4-type zinc finger protein [Gemmataceae bacterium]